MNLVESSSESRFREQVRSWINRTVPPELRGSVDFNDPLNFDGRLQIDKLLSEGGYLAYTWPREHGGSGGGPVEASILDDECGRAGIALSRSPSRMGTNLLGPAVIVHGTEGQRERFLKRILNVEDIWCQGFSEPAAGSDLASVQTSATDHGTYLTLQGSKLWTSQAQHATWCFVLCKTDPDAQRHRNLSMLLVPMYSKGVETRPLVQLTGDDDFSQVFFDGVRVPRDNVLGGPGQGWAVAMTILAAERSYGLMSRYRVYLMQLTRVAQMLREVPGGYLRDAWVVELGTLLADLEGIRDLAFKLVSLDAAGEAQEGLASVSQIWWAETHQKVADLGYRVATELGRHEAEWYRLWLKSRAESIYGGTAQIQRNIIAERALGLPR